MQNIDPYQTPNELQAPELGDKKRPVFVTIMCVIFMLGSITALATINSESNLAMASWYPYLNGSYAVLQLCFVIGMWKMKTWSVWCFIGLVAVNLIIHAIFFAVPLFAIVIWAVICMFLLKAFSQVGAIQEKNENKTIEEPEQRPSS